MSVFNPAFDADALTISFAAGPATTNIQLPTGTNADNRARSPNYNVRIVNEGPNYAYVRFGSDNAVQAVVPAGTGGSVATSDHAIPPNVPCFFRLPNNLTWLSAVTQAAQTAQLRISAGVGGF